MRRIGMGCLAAAAAFTLGAESASAETRVFTATGTEEQFVVPAGVTSLQVTATGEAGGSRSLIVPTPGGRGATVTGTLPVTPGTTLYVRVGKGTFNGGGTSNGGGASSAQTVPGVTAAALDSRLIVAGGGGGASQGQFGGTAGGDADATPFTTLQCSGGPGTQTDGGTAGTGTGQNSATGGAGRKGLGGAAASVDAGGGGGGLFGGGGGGVRNDIGILTTPCPGGGGSSKVPPGGSPPSLAPVATPASVRIDYATPSGGGSGGDAGGGSGGGSGATPPDTVKPGFSRLSFSSSTFQAAKSGAAITAKVGTRVSYRLSEPATTTFTVQRAAAGRKNGKRCAKPTRKNRKAKRCTRYVKVKGSFNHAGKAGANSFTFRGRIGGRKLRPGRYRLTGVAKDAAGNKSKALTARFRITK